MSETEGNRSVAGETEPEPLRAAVQRCHQRIWERFVHPELGIIYDYIGPDGEDPPAFWWHPTTEEIAHRYPNPQGWSTGMEDSSINGGVYLAAMVTAHRLTGAEGYATKARRLYQGLIRTATCSSERGFIARSVTYDGASWYPASSVDQYTWWMHGMWTYARSGLATEEQSDAIATVAHEVCSRLERDHWEILREDGETAYYCDLGAFRADRSTRLLEVLLIAHHLTGDDHWRQVYYDKVHEENDRRLTSVEDTLAYGVTPYMVLQTAASLVPLIELETDEGLQDCYIRALNTCARGMWYAIPACYEYDRARIETADWSPDWRKRYPPGGFHKGGIRFQPPGWAFEDRTIRQPCEAMMVVLYAADRDPAMQHQPVRDQLRTLIRRALMSYDYEMLRSYALVYAEAVYWLAAAKGLIER